MVLATKLKKSKLIITLSILLAFIFTIGATYCSLIVVKTVETFGYNQTVKMIVDKQNPSFMDSKKVKESLYECFDMVATIAYYNSADKNEYDDDFYDSQWAVNEVNTYKTFNYYVINTRTNKVFTNIDGEFSPNKDFTSFTPISFSYKDGVFVYSDDLQGPLVSYNIPNYNIEGYYYVDYVHNNAPVDSLAKNINMSVELTQQNTRLYFVLAVICIVLALALGVFSIVLCSKRNEYGEIELLKIDKLPIDIHLILSVILGAIAISLAGIISESSLGFCYSDEQVLLDGFKLVSVPTGAFIGVAWLILIELISSIIRVAKSGKRWTKCFGGTIAIAWLVKSVKKLYVKATGIKNYSLNSFNKRLIWVLVGYCGINVFLFFMHYFWAMQARNSDRCVILCILNNILILAVNIACVVFVVKYIKSLDKIIIAMHNNTLPDVDYNKLPMSLKMLYDSSKASQIELQNAVIKAVKDERMRTELITNVSHDLKTPLTSIINYVDLLKHCDIESDDAKEYITVLDEKGSKLKRLIDDLIEASKVTSGVVNINPINLDLSELATQAIVEHQQEFVDNNLELVFKGDKQSITAFADGNKTFRVIENLLSNARKYSAKGSRVYADVYSENSRSVFEIKNVSAEPLDITPDELKERFVRGDKSRTNEGNGLGLSIADELCKIMNGKLELSIDGDLFKAKVILPNN